MRNLCIGGAVGFAVAFVLGILLFMSPHQVQMQNGSAIPPCHCGCMETGKCKCLNCCVRTADPTYVKPD